VNTVLVTRLTALLAGLSLLVTAGALALLVVGPVTFTTSGEGQAGIASVWTTWPTVAICAGITVALGVLTIRLRAASKSAD
jgi:hypothetical protein